MPHPNDLMKARPWESGLSTPVSPVPTLPLSRILLSDFRLIQGTFCACKT